MELQATDLFRPSLGLNHLNWVLEDELDPDDVAEAFMDLLKALGNRATEHGEAAVAVRWFVNFLDAVRDHGAGLTDRFAERIDLRDRY